MEDNRAPRQVRVRCACGWDTIADVETAVAAAIDHGQRVHNMTATRDLVLASAEWLEPGVTTVDRA